MSPCPLVLRQLPWWAALLWAALVVGVVARVAASPPTSQSVVPIYLMAGERWANAEPLFAPSPPPLDVYRQPPPFAALFAPLTALPPKAVAVAWRLAGLAVFAHGLAGLVGLTAPGLSRLRLGLLAAVAAELVVPSFNNGQANVHLIGAVLCGADDALRGRYWMAAGWLAAGAWTKGYPLAAGLLVAVAVRPVGWRLLLLVGAVFAGSFLMQEPGYVWDQYREFVRNTGADDRTYSTLDRTERDWRIVSRVWVGVTFSEQVAAAVAAVAGLGMAGLTCLSTRRNGPAAGVRTAVGLGSVWMTLFGPATENPTYVLLAPATAIAVGACRGPAAVLAWVSYLLQLAPVLRGLFPTSDVVPLRTAQPIGAAVLLVVLVGEAVGRSALVGRGESANPDGSGLGPCFQPEGLGVLSPGQGPQARRPGWGGDNTRAA